MNGTAALTLHHQSVADAQFIHDERRPRPIGLQLLAQIAYDDPQIVDAPVRFERPSGFEHAPMSNDGCLLCYAQARTGSTCRNATASGRRCIATSTAGVAPACGSGLFKTLKVDRDNQYFMLDSTIVRAQQAASGKGGLRIRRRGVPEAD